MTQEEIDELINWAKSKNPKNFKKLGPSAKETVDRISRLDGAIYPRGR